MASDQFRQFEKTVTPLDGSLGLRHVTDRAFLGSADIGLNQPIERWPSLAMKARYAEYKQQGEALLKQLNWPEALEDILYATERPVGDASVQDWLRELSAMIAMLAHLTLDETGSSLENRQRRRTNYASYPTPPVVGRAIARYVAKRLPDTAETLRVLDPTIEGAPILLECAFELAGRANVRLIGVDRSPAAFRASAALFRLANIVSGLTAPELHRDDCFRAMGEIGPLDAVVNNPPWGERTRNGAEQFAGPADPYTHFVERCIDRLKPGAPFGFVLPGQAITAKTAQDMRKRLLADCQLESVALLPKHCFPRATVRSVLLLGYRKTYGGPRPRTRLISYPPGDLGQVSPVPDSRQLGASALPEDGSAWRCCLDKSISPLLETTTIALGTVIAVCAGIVPYRRGRGQPPQSAETLATRPFTFAEPQADTTPILRGKHVQPFHCLAATEHIRIGRHLALAGDHLDTLHAPRVYLRELCARDGRLVAAPAPAETLPRYGVFSLAVPPEISPQALAAILNSRLMGSYVRSRCDGIFRESFNRIRPNDVRSFPLPSALFDKSWSAKIETLCAAYLVAREAEHRTAILDMLERDIETAYETVEGEA